MLPEVGALEYLIIAAVALIVVGPKDLPMLLRRLGQFVARLRGMASEFRASFDEMARQSELDELRKEVEAMRKGQFADMAAQGDEMKAIASDIERSINDVGVSFDSGPETFNYDDHLAQQAAEEAAHAAPPVSISDSAPPGAEPPAKPKRARKPKAAAAIEPESAPLVEAPKRRRAKAVKIVEAGS